jgi:hypothetical protein
MGHDAVRYLMEAVGNALLYDFHHCFRAFRCIHESG